MLSSWGVAFEPVDVEAKPSAIEELKRLGVKRVPAVVIEDRVFSEWNPRRLAAFVGVEYSEWEHLPPTDLLDRLDKVLAATQRAIRQVPIELLDMVNPGRNRTVRNLGYHIFRVCRVFFDTLEGRPSPTDWAREEAPSEIKDGEAIASYGENVRNRLNSFSRSYNWGNSATTPYGLLTAHEFLERTTWHAAQHLRQLYFMLERMGKTPIDPLDEADFEGLPLPKEVW